YKVRVGTDLVMVGLFKTYYGQDRLQAIVRFARISSMPDEKVPLTLSPNTVPVMVSAYLAEMLSWGGESGSPVFTYGLNALIAPSTVPMSFQNPRLIGLLHGHYEVQERVKPLN